MKRLTLLLLLSLFSSSLFSQLEQAIPKVEVIMPSYPGGETVLFQYISNSLKYPKQAIEKGVTGIVVSSFVIAENGSVQEVKVVQGIGGGCDEAAIEVIENMSSWIPASKGGKAVKVQYMMPIQFDLQHANPKKRKRNRD